jgi:hypothetical protein
MKQVQGNFCNNYTRQFDYIKKRKYMKEKKHPKYSTSKILGFVVGAAITIGIARYGLLGTAVLAEVTTASSTCQGHSLWCSKPDEYQIIDKLDTSVWGAYRPGTYFGMKSKSKIPSVATGLMWSDALFQGKSFRDQTSQDELTRFEWVRHDGKHFGDQKIVDTAYNMRINTSFVVPPLNVDEILGDHGARATWYQRIEAEVLEADNIPATNNGDIDSSSSSYSKNLVFYFGVECSDSNVAGCLQAGNVTGWKVRKHAGSSEHGFNSAVSIVGYSEVTGWFCMFLMAHSDGEVQLSHASLTATDLAAGVAKLKSDAQQVAATASNSEKALSKTSKDRKRLKRQMYDDSGSLSNKAAGAASFVAVQAAFTGNAAVRLDAVLYDHLAVGSEEELVRLLDHVDGPSASTGGSIAGSAAEDKAKALTPSTASAAGSFLRLLGGLSSSREITLSHRDLILQSKDLVVPPEPEELLRIDQDGTGEILQLPPGSEAGSAARRVRTAPAATGKVASTSGRGASSKDVISLLPEDACESTGQCIRATVDALLVHFRSAFDASFAAAFPLSLGSTEASAAAAAAAGRGKEGKAVVRVGPLSAADVEAAKVCLSSVLGGMTYMTGKPVIGAAAIDLGEVDNGDDDGDAAAVMAQSQAATKASEAAAERQQLSKEVFEAAPQVHLFTATPSRTAFPRGFLWDEGFHQLLVSRWSPALSLEVLDSWLQAMHFPCEALGATADGASAGEEEAGEESSGSGSGSGSSTSSQCRDSEKGGWIPREMILGKEAQARVPEEFVQQRVDIANPPTFLLLVDSLLTRYSSGSGGEVSPECAAARNQYAVQTAKRDLQRQQEGSPEDVPSNEEDLLSQEELEELEVLLGGGGSGGGGKEVQVSSRELIRMMRNKTGAASAANPLLLSGLGACSSSALQLYRADRSLVLEFLRDRYERLHLWVQWFLRTQRGSPKHPGSFRWRGRSPSDGKVIPNTLASGLDDYPRSPLPTAEEHHVDLHAWMTKAVGVLARLQDELALSGYPLSPRVAAMARRADYAAQHAYLLTRLDELHWSEEHQGYFDVGLNNEAGHAFTKKLVFRCANPSDQSTRDVQLSLDLLRQKQQQQKSDFCPASHPKPLFPLGDGQGNYKMVDHLQVHSPALSHIPRVGYVALFPLLLRLVDPQSPRLGALLHMLSDPHRGLWSPHGLRSLAPSDTFYQRRNSDGDAPYWR